MPSLDAVPKKFALVGIQEGKKGKIGKEKKNQNGRHSRRRRTEKKWLRREGKYKVSEEGKMVRRSVVFSRLLKALFLSFLCFFSFFIPHSLPPPLPFTGAPF